MTKERLKGHALIFSANLIFGVNYPISKWLLAERLTPEFHTLARMVFACAMFWALSFFLPREKLSLKEIAVLFVCSTCGVAGNQALFIQGLSMTSPIDASVISTGTPIFVMILAAIFLHEPITKLKIGGVLLGATGAAWLVSQSMPQGDVPAVSSIPGNLCVLASCVVYAIYFVFSKPLSERYRAVTMMKWMFLFASIEVAPFTIPSIIEPNGVLLAGAEFDAKTLGALAYVVGGATFLAYLLIPMAVRRIRPTTASMYNYVQPIVACVIAIIIAQDTFSWQKLLAAAAVFLGVYMVTKSKARRDMLPPTEAKTIPPQDA